MEHRVNGNLTVTDNKNTKLVQTVLQFVRGTTPRFPRTAPRARRARGAVMEPPRSEGRFVRIAPAPEKWFAAFAMGFGRLIAAAGALMARS